MREPLSRDELKRLIPILKAMAEAGRGWPVARAAREIRVSKDYVRDHIGKEFDLMREKPVKHITAKSMLQYLKDTYTGPDYYDLFD